MNFITDLKKLIKKYVIKIKTKWLLFITDIKIMLGFKPKPKKRGRPRKSV